jgi:hypothetical protein
MPVSALPQAPYRQDRKIFPTPLTTDVLFSEIRDCNRSDFPAYGTPHPNAVKWPHHKLIFIKPVDIERNEIFEFFYAADRENQDLYNFSSGYRNIGGNREFKIVLREYVTPRAEFDASVPAFKDAMPDVPAGVFDGVSYIFFDKQQKKTEQTELDSHYVLETHTYVETALLDDYVSLSTQVPDLMPDKFRALIPRTTTENIVEGKAKTPVLGTDLLQASEEQINPDVKLVKTISSNRKAAAGKKLLSQRSYVETTVGNIEETYSSEKLDVETGLLIAQSSVTDLGNGDYVRETVKVDEWPTLVSTAWNPELSAQVMTVETFVPSTDISTGSANTSYKAVNKDRSLKTVTYPPTTELDNYMIEIPSRMDVDLPKILKSIGIVWSTEQSTGETKGDWSGYANGENFALSGSEGSSASAVATIRPELDIEIEQPVGVSIPVTVHAFFVRMNNNKVTEAQIKAKVGAPLSWPMFKPVSNNIICKGVKVGVRCSASGTASVRGSKETYMQEKGETKGEDYDISLNINVVTLPATLHAAIPIADSTKKVEAKATATAYWNGTNFPSLKVTSEAKKDVEGKVSPSSLAATSPPDIPRTGKYLMRSTVEPYNWGYAKCTAVVLDASVFK